MSTIASANKKLAVFLATSSKKDRADAAKMLGGAAGNDKLTQAAVKGLVPDLTAAEAKALAGAIGKSSVDDVFKKAAPALYENVTGGGGSSHRADAGGAPAGSTVRGRGNVLTSITATGSLDRATIEGISRGWAEGRAANGDDLELNKTRRPGGNYFAPATIKIAGEDFIVHVSKQGGASFNPDVASTDKAYWVCLEKDGMFSDTFGIKRWQSATIA